MDDVFVAASSSSPMGPQACSFWVEIPISQPRPNSPPSVKRVEQFTYTAALSTAAVNRSASACVRVRMVLAVAGGVLCNVSNGFAYAVHHLDGKDIVQKLGVKVRRAGGRTGNDGGGACVQPQLYRQLARSNAVGAKTLREPGRNSCAMAECTRHTSSALHTLGRLALAFSIMSSAFA